jgi:predicted transcriptional regulator
MSDHHEMIELTADIVAAYVANNPVPAADLPGLITSLHSKLVSLSGVAKEPETKEPQQPAVNPRKSVHPDHIFCLEDGIKFTSMKRHLMSGHGLTPEAYRKKWGLGPDYPMVAPSYSARRSELAKDSGLGHAPAPATEKPSEK